MKNQVKKFMNCHEQGMALRETTKRMLQIETQNMAYNKATNNGINPNGQESEIELLLSEWDKLKVQRQDLKDNQYYQ